MQKGREGLRSGGGERTLAHMVTCKLCSRASASRYRRRDGLVSNNHTGNVS